MSKYIGTATAKKSAISDCYEELEVAAIAARCILATHSATLDALRRAHFEEHPNEDRNAPRLHLWIEEDIQLAILWDFRSPAGSRRDASNSSGSPTDAEELPLAADENDGHYSEELLRSYCEEFELATILEIERDLAEFRSYCSNIE